MAALYALIDRLATAAHQERVARVAAARLRINLMVGQAIRRARERAQR